MEKREEDTYTHAVQSVNPVSLDPLTAQVIRPLDECEDYEGKRFVWAMMRCEECEKLERLNDACEKVDINDSSSRRASREEGEEEEEEVVDELEEWKMSDWLT